jgi:hypothetical protein
MTRTSVLAERAALGAWLVLIADPAYAYIDPGTGAAVTTAILGFLGSIAYTFRKYMYRVKDLFTKSPAPPKPAGEDGSVDR